MRLRIMCRRKKKLEAGKPTLGTPYVLIKYTRQFFEIIDTITKIRYSTCTVKKGEGFRAYLSMLKVEIVIY